MRVRPAAPTDIPTMLVLAQHSATAAHWSREQYELLFDKNALPRAALVIEESDVVQGFLVAKEVAGEWEIENIAVSGAARRRGLGTRLLGEFLDQARDKGASAVFLEVRESNVAARALYEKWAFEKSGSRARYYTHPEEDAIMYRVSFE